MSVLAHSGAAARWIHEQFDEERYLRAYPDVAAAVEAGAIASGRAHFEAFGFTEGRYPCPVPRLDRLLRGVDVGAQQGVEIGPLANPAVTRDQGRILYVDYTDTSSLVEAYRDDPNVDTAAIVAVDAVWGERKLKECLPDGMRADYVVASHVIEHVPDLIGWLREIAEVLAPGGEVRLAIPDRRYSFDIARVETGLHDAFDAYLRQARVPLPRAVADFQMSFREVATRAAWLGEVNAADLPPRHQPGVALESARRVHGTGAYIDTHCWVFTPYSFAGLMEQLVLAELLCFACADFSDTAPFELEFFAGLRATGDREAAAQSWRLMRHSVRREPVPGTRSDDAACEPAATVRRVLAEKAAALAEGAAAHAAELALQMPAHVVQAERKAMQFDLRAHRAERALAEAQARATVVSARLDAVTRDLAAITTSRTWRATAPARTVLAAVRRTLGSRLE